MYIIAIGGYSSHVVGDTMTAYEAWRRSCVIAELLGVPCSLADAATGEIVASTEDCN